MFKDKLRVGGDEDAPPIRHMHQFSEEQKAFAKKVAREIANRKRRNT
jgi:hypothetical protein